MIERYFTEPGLYGDAYSGEIWVAIGRRLERRRTELGYSADCVAQWAGISVEAYKDYENGAPISASLLEQVADLLDSPVVWFFEGIASPPAEVEAQQSPQPATYTVATTEHRIQALADSFRKLDFEGQQHLLAISRALSRSNARLAQD